jgi:hypothetical protein
VAESPTELVERLYRGFPADLVELIADEQGVRAWKGMLEEVAHPDFVAGDPDQPMIAMAPGVDVFVETWRDWLGAWKRWWVEPGELREGTDGQVVQMLEITAVSKKDSVEMKVGGANVIWVEDGLVTRIELHFDRNAALARAGLSRGPSY